MIGGLSSGLSTALRTATAARATMDDMTRQIATGKRVASVKDDGAAWARANDAKVEAATWQWRTDELRRGRALARLEDEHLTAGVAIHERMASILRQMSSTEPNSSARRMLAADWRDAIAEWDALEDFRVASDAIRGGPATEVNAIGGPVWGSDWWIDLWNNDPYLDEIRYPWVWTLGTLSNQPGYAPVTMAIRDAIEGASIADIQTATTEMTTGSNGVERHVNRANRMSAAYGRMVNAETTASIMADRLNTQIGALTDADLGAASTARASAETRQALAMQTVRAALDAYSAKAAGLLANVQRTQRSVMA